MLVVVLLEHGMLGQRRLQPLPLWIYYGRNRKVQWQIFIRMADFIY